MHHPIRAIGAVCLLISSSTVMADSSAFSAPPDVSVFHCSGRSRDLEPKETYPALMTEGPAGQLELTLLAPPREARVKDRSSALLTARVSIRAEGARVFELAQALSERLKVNFAADEKVANARLYLRADDLSLEKLGTLLKEEYGVVFGTGFTTLEEANRIREVIRRAMQNPYPLKIRSIRVGNLTLGRDIAALLCQEVLSERGKVVALGHTLLIKDTLDYLNQASSLVDALDLAKAEPTTTRSSGFHCDASPAATPVMKAPAPEKPVLPAGKASIRLLKISSGAAAPAMGARLAVQSDGASLYELLFRAAEAIPFSFVAGVGIDRPVYISAPDISLGELIRALHCANREDGLVVCESEQERDRRRTQELRATPARRDAAIAKPSTSLSLSALAQGYCHLTSVRGASATVIGERVVFFGDPNGPSTLDMLATGLLGKAEEGLDREVATEPRSGPSP
ncbi:MAG: hypothetical protein HY901_01540 [Deltaproteobacteria bacterium]|nr:hypothetical protein [Deltaproteobacteria bacterium]